MISELSFLIELLLNHELKKETKDLIAGRIKEVEANLVAQPIFLPTRHTTPVPNPTLQSPSTLAAMARHGGAANIPVTPDSPPAPVVLTGNEMQARENSMEILKKRKQQQLKV